MLVEVVDENRLERARWLASLPRRSARRRPPRDAWRGVGRWRVIATFDRNADLADEARGLLEPLPPGRDDLEGVLLQRRVVGIDLALLPAEVLLDLVELLLNGGLDVRRRAVERVGEVEDQFVADDGWRGYRAADAVGRGAEREVLRAALERNMDAQRVTGDVGRS